MTKKAQSSIEIVFVFGFGFIILLLFIGISNTYMANLGDEKEWNLVEDLTFKIQKEVFIASQNKDGYSRNFSLPLYLGRNDYSITIYGNNVYVISKEKEFFLRIPNATGNFVKGDNIIIKEDGQVSIN